MTFKTMSRVMYKNLLIAFCVVAFIEPVKPDLSSNGLYEAGRDEFNFEFMGAYSGPFFECWNKHGEFKEPFEECLAIKQDPRNMQERKEEIREPCCIL